MMNVLLKKLAEWLYEYGIAAAGMCSFRGSYEAPVPIQLRSTKEK